MLKSIEFLREKSRGRVGGGGGLSPLAPVILCPVHRILLQQGTNLVNKLVLLLHKCQLREDSRNKSENDGCWGRGVSAFSQYGRSMIEMLGVLAIIGVLSVGGIAGYSKAMEQFRINKAISEYSMLIFGMLEHLDDFKKTTTSMTENAEVFTVAESLSLVPQSWNKINNLQYADSYGNMIQLWIFPDYSYDNSAVLTLDFYLGGVTKTSDSKNISANFSAKLCMEIYQKIAIPLHAAAWDANIYKSGGGSFIIDGDSACDGEQKCLTNITLAEIHSICDACTRSREACAIVMHF